MKKVNIVRGGCRDRHHEEGIHQVIVGSERGSTFPIQIEQLTCNALIDT